MKIAMIGHKMAGSRYQQHLRCRVPGTTVPGTTRGTEFAAGGVEKHVEEIAVLLAERGHDVTCFNRKGYGDEKLSEWKGVRLKYIAAPAIKGIEALIYSFLASIHCMAGSYDIVHYHALGPAVMCFIPKLAGKRVVVTVHGLDWKRAKWGFLARKYLKLGEIAAIVFSDRIITVSEDILKYYCMRYNSWQKTCYIPNGVSPVPDREAHIINKEYGLQKNSYILFLARLVPEKGCHYLINAFNNLEARVKNSIRLVIAGGSGHCKNYASMLKLCAGEDILFTGEVKGRVVEELFSNALFYILPSNIEGMPISLLEAMSAGLCPLVSDINENLAIIGSDSSYGYSFEAGRDDSLKCMLKYMLENIEEVRERGLSAKEYIKKNFLWSNAADGLEEVYRGTVGKYSI